MTSMVISAQDLAGHVRDIESRGSRWIPKDSRFPEMRFCSSSAAQIARLPWRGVFQTALLTLLTGLCSGPRSKVKREPGVMDCRCCLIVGVGLVNLLTELRTTRVCSAGDKALTTIALGHRLASEAAVGNRLARGNGFRAHSTPGCQDRCV